MHLIDFIAIAPIIILGVAVVAVMMLIAFHRHHGATATVSFAGLAAAFSALPAADAASPRFITPLLVSDTYGIFFTGVILAATMITVLFSYPYLARRTGHREEFYLLLLTAVLGAVVLVLSHHFASFFLGLEILSVSLYTLIAYTRFRTQSIEAGIKYLVLAAVSSAFMLFGIALIYADRGSLGFSHIAPLMQSIPDSGNSMALMAGVGLVIVAVGFKLAVVPFHMWTPDIYQGAPAPVTGFVASVSKGAMVALLIRFFEPVDPGHSDLLFGVFAALAVASMVTGNILALKQANIKRLLAYSSIAHMGYLLVAFLAGGRFSVYAVTFYLVVYSISILGCFAVISLLSGKDRDADAMADFQGLFFRHPWLAAAFTAMLLSLAGIPLTAGFVGKFYIVTAGAKDALWFLVFVLVLTSGIGLFYYLRVIIAMYTRPSENTPVHVTYPVAMSGTLALVILTGFLFWFGMLPAAFIELIAQMVG